MKKFTIVIPFRDRDIDRVLKCLESLKRQTFQNFKAILVDFGSQERVSEQVKILVASYPFCKLLFADTRGLLWSRSQALNAGMAIAETPFVISTDVDMIFSPGFMEYLEKTASSDTRLFIQCYYLTKEMTSMDLDTIFSKSTRSLLALELAERDVAYGGFQCTTKGLIRFLRGFDEYYKLWGVQDTDMNKRLGITGIKKKWGDYSVAPIFHQWHPKVNKTNQVAFVNGWHDIELLHYNRLQSAIRNNDHWDKPLSDDDRPILKFIRYRQRGDFFISKTYPVNDAIMKDLYFVKLQFDFMKKGEVLQVRYLNKESINKPYLTRIKLRVIESLRWRLGLDLRLNLDAYLNKYISFVLAKDNLMWLILYLVNEDKLTDYYIRFDDCELNAYLMK